MVEVVKELQVTEATWYRLAELVRAETTAEATRRTVELEKENARLKRLLAEKELAIAILNEAARGVGTFCLRGAGQNRWALRKKKPEMGFEEARLRADLRATAEKHPEWRLEEGREHLLAQPQCRARR